MKKWLYMVWLICSAAANAQWHGQDSNQPVQDMSNQKSHNGFGVSLFLTDAPKEVHREWNTPSSYTPHIKTASTVKRGGSLTAMMVFGGCAVQKPQCRATVDFRIRKPDGSVDNVKGGKLWDGSEKLPNNIVFLSNIGLTFTADPGDAVGNYKVEALVNDPDSGAKFQLEVPFTLEN